MHEQARCRDEAGSYQLPTAAAFWIIRIVSMEECSSLMQNLLQDLLLCSLTHFECDSHTVHIMMKWHLPPPLTSTVKLSLFTHAHSSSLSLAARLHRCHANCSHYINNGWTFPRQTRIWEVTDTFHPWKHYLFSRLTVGVWILPWTAALFSCQDTGNPYLCILHPSNILICSWGQKDFLFLLFLLSEKPHVFSAPSWQHKT